METRSQIQTRTQVPRFRYGVPGVQSKVPGSTPGFYSKNELPQDSNTKICALSR